MPEHKKTGSTLLALAGLVTGAWLSLKAYQSIRRRAVPPLLPRLADGGESKGVAVVTGASSGIGAAFAFRLAADGYDLILVARRAERLWALAEILQKQFPVLVDVQPADLNDPDDLERIEACIAAEDRLALLINNAGFGTTGRFARVEFQRQLAMINLHILASVRLTKAALAGMIARRAGGIINVSSTASFTALPGGVTYSATKAYLNVFSEGLQSELLESGVRVQALCPGYTYTEFHDSPEFEHFQRSHLPRFMWMSAEDVVAESLACLPDGPVICVPGLFNQALAAILSQPAIRPLVHLGVQILFRGPLRWPSPGAQALD